jgi:hypothetical protein
MFSCFVCCSCIWATATLIELGLTPRSVFSFDPAFQFPAHNSCQCSHNNPSRNCLKLRLCSIQQVCTALHVCAGLELGSGSPETTRLVFCACAEKGTQCRAICFFRRFCRFGLKEVTRFSSGLQISLTRF